MDEMDWLNVQKDIYQIIRSSATSKLYFKKGENLIKYTRHIHTRKDWFFRPFTVPFVFVLVCMPLQSIKKAYGKPLTSLLTLHQAKLKSFIHTYFTQMHKIFPFFVAYHAYIDTYIL